MTAHTRSAATSQTGTPSAAHRPVARPGRHTARLAGLAAAVVGFGTVLSVLVPGLASAATTSASAANGQVNCAVAPSACGYPDASTTGVPDGTTLRTVPTDVASGPGWYF